MNPAVHRRSCERVVNSGQDGPKSTRSQRKNKMNVARKYDDFQKIGQKAIIKNFETVNPFHSKGPLDT